MDATSKYSNQKNKKLVRFNKKRAIIISIIVVILLASLGVGLYFALRPTLPSIGTKSSVPAEKVSYEEALDIVHETDTPVGILFESTECHYCNYIMYGEDTDNPYQNDEIKGDKTAQGEFGKYLDSPERQMPWYIVEEDTISEANQDLTDFFLKDYYNDDDQIEPTTVSEFSGANYLGELRGDSVDTYKTEMDDQGKENVTFSIGVDEEGKGVITSDVPVEEDSSDDTEEDVSDFPFGIPFAMWFNHGELQFFTSGATLPGDSTDEHETQDNTVTVDDLLQLESEDINGGFSVLGKTV